MAVSGGSARALRSRAKEFLSFRQHPIKIIKYTTRYLWLLLLSLAKYLIASHFDIKGWIEANWFDLVILSAIFGFAFIRWITVYFELGSDRIITHTGFLGMTRTVVFFEEIASVSLCQGPVSFMLRNCTVYIDTDAKCVQSTDIRIDLTKSKAMEIYHTISCKSKTRTAYVYKANKKQLLIFSLLFSSAVSGAIVLLTILYQAYRITDDEFNKRLIDTVNDQMHIIEGSGIWMYFLAAGLAIALIFVASFVSNLLRHWDLTCKRGEDFLRVRSGKGARRHHLLRRKYMNYLDFTQSFFMRMFNICSVEVSCTGYGKRRKEISAIIPITTSKDAVMSARMLVPEYTLCRPQIKTNRACIPGFIILPVLSALVPIAAGIVMQRFFPWRRTQIIFIEIMTALPLIWLTIVKVEAAVSTSFGFSGNSVTLSYCRWYTFHRIALKKERITKIAVRQNPFARLFGTCTVIFYTTGEKTRRHLVGGVNYKRTMKLLKDNGYDLIGKAKDNT